MKNDATIDALARASKGLLFPSETEAELVPFALREGEAFTAERLLVLSESPAGTPVEKSTLADLWRTVPSEDRAKFLGLQKALESHLAGIAVYKIGADAEKLVYIVGKAQDGRWAGLKTIVVET
jgi:hypothetical protein